MAQLRKIAVMTGTRADYGLLKNLIAELNVKANGLNRSVELQIIATGSHLSAAHGMTVDARGTAFTKEPALCVADRGNRRIQYLSLDGKHLGFVTDGMRMPCDMKVRGDRMLVPDLESVVTIVDAANKPVAQLCDGKPSDLRGAPREKFIPGKFVHPHDAIWLANGDILVAEWVPIGRVTLLRSLA